MDKVVHFEIPSEDVARAKNFYKNSFGWETTEYPEMEYTVLKTAKTGEDGMINEVGAINGGMMKRGDVIKSPVITIGVANIDASIKKVIKHGGKVAMKKMEIPRMGYAAYIQDTEGNVIGLFQSSTN